MKRAVRKAVRPRWLVLLALAAAIAAALVASTTASSADGIPVSNPAHPVVDANWIYDHNWYESNAVHLQGRRLRRLPAAGDDLCPGGGTPGDLNNLPANYNGAQEFYSWWKGVGTTSTPQPNGNARQVDHRA